MRGIHKCSYQIWAPATLADGFFSLDEPVPEDLEVIVFSSLGNDFLKTYYLPRNLPCKYRK
jgi:hypothetical protein